MSAKAYPTRYGTFEVKWRENGIQKSKSFKSPIKAESYADEVNERLEEGKPVLRRKDVPLLKSYTLSVLAEKKLEDQTLKGYLQVLNKHVFPHMGDWNLLDCRPRRIGEWRKERLEAQAGRRAIGLRPQDALALEVKHVGDRLQVVQRVSAGRIIPGSKTGRHKRRSVFLPEAVAVDIDNWLIRRTVDSPLLFPRTKDGQPWSKTDFDNWRQRKPRGRGKDLVRQKCFKTAAIECGLGSSLTPYGLRHTAATMYAGAGWNHIEIAHQLGHSPEESMRTYQHLIEERQGKPKKSVDQWINEARGIKPAASERKVPR